MKDELTITPPKSFLFKGFATHLVLTVLVAIPLAYYLRQQPISLPILSVNWGVVSVAIPVVHQWVIWFGWRTQLCFHLFTKRFHEVGVKLWALIFMSFLSLRLISMILLCRSTSKTLPISTSISIPLGIGLFPAGVYTFYSTMMYFGVYRGTGSDHFRESDRIAPFVKGGIFKYFNNSMYIFIPPVLIGISILFKSKPGLISAVFQWLWIWIHYYVTEKPDLEVLHPMKAE